MSLFRCLLSLFRCLLSLFCCLWSLISFPLNLLNTNPSCLVLCLMSLVSHSISLVLISYPFLVLIPCLSPCPCMLWFIACLQFPFIGLSWPVYLLKPLTPYFPSHFSPLSSHGSNQRKRGVSARVRALINCIDTKAKCRHLKIWPVQRLCGRCFIRVYKIGDPVSHGWYFRPSFVSCWPCSPLSGSPLPPSPLHYVK